MTVHADHMGLDRVTMHASLQAMACHVIEESSCSGKAPLYVLDDTPYNQSLLGQVRFMACRFCVTMTTVELCTHILHTVQDSGLSNTGGLPGSCNDMRALATHCSSCT